MPRISYEKKLIAAAIALLEEKKAQDIVVLDLTKKSAAAHYFVICSGTSTRHVAAMADDVTRGLKKQGFLCHHSEGAGAGTWELIDYGDVMIHIFYHQTRHFYALEKLWGSEKTAPVKKKKT